MYGKRIGALFLSDLTVLQKEEIRKGMDEGLTGQELNLFAKPYFNHLQMNEIRKALHEGIDISMIRKYWKHTRSYRVMREMRIAAVSGEAMPVQSFLPAAAAGMLVLSMSLSLAIWLARHPSDNLSLELTAEEAVLMTGEMFDPMAYILSYSGNDAVLVLPHGISTEKPGNRTAVYKLIGKKKTITRELQLTITGNGSRKKMASEIQTGK